MNADFYISPRAITITPNAENNNPDYVGISVVGGTAIRVRNVINAPDGNGGTTRIEIGYAPDLSYRKWTLIGGNTYVGNDHSYALNIYARLDASEDGDKGLVMLSKDDKPLETTTETGHYYFLKIGELSAPQQNGLRDLILWDTGELDTNQGINNEKNGDFDKAFTLGSQHITPKLPFYGLKLFANSGITFLTNGFFKFGENGTAINELITTVSGTAANFSNWAKANAIATTQSIASYCRSFFIRKDADDVTAHKLTMNSMACTGNNMPSGAFAADITGDAKITGTTQMHGGFIAGDQTSQTQNYVENVRGSKLYWNGSGWRFDCDYLQVNKKAFFKELEIEKVSHIGGQQILTACGCKIDHVYYHPSSGYSVFFAKEDKDGNPITNDWKVGDLAYCQSFNVNEGVSQDFSNKYYWVRVLNVSAFSASNTAVEDSITHEIFDPHNYHRIIFKCENAQGATPYCDIPSINADGTPCIDTTRNASDTPAIGDNIVLMGHVKQNNETQAEAEERQGATLLAGAGRWGQALIMWQGIGANANNPFIMPEPKVVISPQMVKVLADEIALSSSGKLLLSSDQLTCTNTDGNKTMWLDALGNVNIAGILNRMQIEIEGDKFDYFFNSLDANVIDPTIPDPTAPDTLLFSDDDGSVMLTHITESDGDEITDPANWYNSILRVPDILRLDGMVRLAYEASLNNNGVYDRGEEYQIVFPFIFPYEREMQLDGINYNVRYETCRTATSANGTRHLITWQELNSLVGRKITIENVGPDVRVTYPSFVREGLMTQEGGELVTRTVYTFNGYKTIDLSRLGFTIEYVSGIVKHSIDDNDYTLDRGIFPFLSDVVDNQYPTEDDWGTII